jgi:transposase
MGTNTSLAPLYAYSPKGQRATAEVPRNRGPNTTLVSSMSLEGMGSCLAVVGSTTREVFEAYVERVLAPTLQPGEVVVMDNLAAHKGSRVRELVEARGCDLLYLPPYSPDLNPIEEAFSMIKGTLRKAEARTRDALVEAMGVAISAVSARDASGFFAHCGYSKRFNRSMTNALPRACVVETNRLSYASMRRHSASKPAVPARISANGITSSIAGGIPPLAGSGSKVPLPDL